DIILASGKTGIGIEDILKAVISRIPAPKGDPEAPLQAMIFDSVYNSFRGVEVIFRIFNGTFSKGDKIKFVNTGREYEADEIGILGLNQIPQQTMSAGNVGYLISGVKVAKEIKVGDTITHIKRPCESAIQGIEEVKPMVFAGIYAVETTGYEELRASVQELPLNDGSLVWEPETSMALGFGFRCGFLRMLHMEIIQERLEREFDMTVITTVPSVQFKALLTDDTIQLINAPSDMPDPT